MATEFSLLPWGSDLRETWDAVVRASRNGNFLDYHAHRFDEQSLLVLRKNRPVAVFPCNRLEDRIISHGGLTYAGLIYDDTVRAADALAIFGMLVERYRALRCRVLTYKAIPHLFHRYPAEEDLYALFRYGARVVRRDLSTVIRMDRRPGLSDSRKSTIRKAQRHGVTVLEGDFFDPFHALLAQAIRRFGATPVHSADEMRLLQNRFPGWIRLFGAFRDERLIAGALIFDFGHVAHSQYLASSEEGKALGALDLLLAHLLDREFAEREAFSFGISTEQEGRTLNEGLVFQKEGFGGRALVHDFYEICC